MKKVERFIPHVPENLREFRLKAINSVPEAYPGKFDDAISTDKDVATCISRYVIAGIMDWPKYREQRNLFGAGDGDPWPTPPIEWFVEHEGYCPHCARNLIADVTAGRWLPS